LKILALGLMNYYEAVVYSRLYVGITFEGFCQESEKPKKRTDLEMPENLIGNQKNESFNFGITF
jgi:hypothetical protein